MRKHWTIFSASQTSLSQAPQCSEEDNRQQKGWGMALQRRRWAHLCRFPWGRVSFPVLDLQVEEVRLFTSLVASLSRHWEGFSVFFNPENILRCFLLALRQRFSVWISLHQVWGPCPPKSLQASLLQLLSPGFWIAEVYRTQNLPKYFPRCVWVMPGWPVGRLPLWADPWECVRSFPPGWM